MKWISITIAMTLTASVSLADSLTPLADLPIGTNASGKITLIATNAVGGATLYMANVFTDTGARAYPVVLPPEVNPAEFVGKRCLIEAVIEKDDTTKWKRRFRITQIELQNPPKKEPDK